MQTKKRAAEHTTDPDRMLSLRTWADPADQKEHADIKPEAFIDCGWGRLIFGQTFTTPASLADTLSAEASGERDIVLYAREPHVVLAQAPQLLFLDPSHTYRLDFLSPGPVTKQVAKPLAASIRLATEADAEEINRLYLSRGMVPLRDGYMSGGCDSSVSILVAESRDGGLSGVVMGVDHTEAFNDPDNGSSLWALAVDPQARAPGVGTALVLALAERFRQASRAFMDLSVKHDNVQAIALYEKLGFTRVPVFCIKRKNAVNETLFVGPAINNELNIYARIIVEEARRRGIAVDIEDAEAGLFRLSFGGRAVACRESLSDMTSAVALSRCDDKALTRRLLAKAGLRVPEQLRLTTPAEASSFLERHGRVVVKPARGEQGRGVFVDLTTEDEVTRAIERARQVCDQVLVEEFVTGDDLRIIVIDGAVVAAAIRKPASVEGDGKSTIRTLIEHQSRRRAAATGGESNIPLDRETERAVFAAGYKLDHCLPAGEVLAVRKTANLHTGGTIHDVTAELNPDLAAAAIAGARALDIPLVGFDFLVPDVAGPDYVIIEANERPGLANHEPQPTAERFVDFLFPHSRVNQEASAI
ncbi:MAG: N-acetylglutaminylglutamine synthetase [Rhodopseudomonas sp.]|nr:N-acetylglutaminylglutamine synthetase [Rhodopseudomonas sp.]